MQPHTEHQQDNADFRQLGRQVGIGDKARRERPDQYPGQQIAGDW